MEERSKSEVIFSLLFLAFWLIIGPMSVIFALNTLFNLNIVFSVDSWCAVVILYSLFKIQFEVK